ncbi:MAG: diacylglycerol/polyprenol kinase family protein [Candidatus Syntropharchaeia archaeon]
MPSKGVDWSGKRKLLEVEIRRKTLHLCGISIPLAYYFTEKELMLVILFSGMLLAIGIEWGRFKGIFIFPDFLLREEEDKQVAAYVYFIIASFISVLIFDKTIAIVSILMLGIGDAVVGVTGILLNILAERENVNVRSGGKFRSKTVELMIVMFLTCFTIGYFFSLPVHMVVAGALGATIADAFPWKFLEKPVDDNLTIPLFSGALMMFGKYALSC